MVNRFLARGRVRFELHSVTGRADGVLGGMRCPLCDLEAIIHTLMTDRLTTCLRMESIRLVR